MESKRCFVICPIGEEGSPERTLSDDVLDLVIVPALEIFHFTVIRADRIVGSGSGQINTEVVELVQNAELCIVDLTGQNPNVFYECGRRHETAKPVIQIAREGDALPFDLVGFRTLRYNLREPRSVHSAVQEIRRHVQALEESGYGSSTSGVSTVTLAQAIDRIERKLDRLNTAGSVPVGIPTQPHGAVMGLQDVLRNPHEAFLSAVATGNISNAILAFQQVRRITTDPEKIIALAGLLASQGVRDGASALSDILAADNAYRLDNQVFQAGVSALVRYYSLTDTEADGIELVTAIIMPRLVPDADAQHRAFLHNQLQIMHWGAQQYDKALEHGLAAIALMPENTAYKYNVSMIYEAIDLLADAERLVDEYMTLERDAPDADHLSQAIDVYLKVHRDADVQATYTKLAEIDSEKAAVKTLLDNDLRRVIYGS